MSTFGIRPDHRVPGTAEGFTLGDKLATKW
jgi:hypothetical protein